MKVISLPDHIAILQAYEDTYHQSKGGDCCDIVAQIIEEITSHSKGKGKFKQEDVKNLETVSQPSYQFNPEISSTSTQRIKNLYNNHKNVLLEDESILIPVGTVWNYRLVI